MTVVAVGGSGGCCYLLTVVMTIYQAPAFRGKISLPAEHTVVSYTDSGYETLMHMYSNISTLANVKCKYRILPNSHTLKYYAPECSTCVLSLEYRYLNTTPTSTLEDIEKKMLVHINNNTTYTGYSRKFPVYDRTVQL